MREERMIIWYWSVKGGVGTSVVAAATAVRLASEDRETTLVDLTGDQPALLGMIAGAAPPEPGIGDWVAAGDGVAADAIGRLLEDVAPGLRLLRDGTQPALAAQTADGENQRSRLVLALEMLARIGPVVVDAGLDPFELRTDLAASHRPVCVLRSCYLALNRAQRTSGPYDSVVLVEEPGRALRVRDVAAAVGASSVKRVAWDPRVARSVDAGTIVSMLPPPLRRFELPE
ncbi:MAG: ArsA family ATPase [Acidimicrobiaceae bacterium]|nr:ArsA family ATPase [Acidimicrobiaceae bacterium]MXZ52799.1 ArsA family ATPase [Acidimicrobiaceae bacterium]MYE76208.1 ArsA family ATPase [Acidimicrobiaceae bacterium]MYE97041.1 ArsA family ATPase [Acidimicrobiaceae bacterium]MYH43188.1 ArsA family ATPase [Acidimicrobiaceae bacterium]